MVDAHHDPTRIFAPEDRLHLLQLETRRVMAERLVRTDESEGDDDSQSEGPGSRRRRAPENWRLVPETTTLHDWQRECLPRWLEHGRGTVKVATGGGKTLFALAAAEKLQNERVPNLRLVIVVPTIPLMFQWRDEVRRGNVPERAIGLMGGGQELPAISKIRVLICVLNSAREKLSGLVEKAKWSEHMMLVVDECHRSNATQARQIFDCKARYTLGLSATPEQDAEAEGLPSDEAYAQGAVGQALGPIICEFTLKQSLAAGLLTPFEVWHIGLPLSGEEAGEYSRLSREITDLRKSLQIGHRRSRSSQGFIAWCQTQASRGGPSSVEAERFVSLANRRKRLLYRSEARRRIALGLLSEAVADPESRAIVFHESIEEIESLFLDGLAAGLPAVLEHSQLPDGLRADNIEAFREGLARVIISAKSLVEGFNVPSADLGVIAASTSSVRQRIQSLGRMLRRKSGGRTARIAVLYVRDTEDEAIYERADWENVVGAERNRYFLWDPVPATDRWDRGLSETGTSPRVYRPPSWEIDVSTLALGDPYPGQAQGVDLRVDPSSNLRTEDGQLVPAPPEWIAAIVERNPLRRARCTPAGHLITRVDAGTSKSADWRFLGIVEIPAEPATETVTRLRIKTTSGRRVIALEDERRRGAARFALGPESSHTRESGVARDRLLAWVREIESTRSIEVRDLYWNNAQRYWVEIGGERIPFEGEVGELEFSK